MGGNTPSAHAREFGPACPRPGLLRMWTRNLESHIFADNCAPEWGKFTNSISIKEDD